MTTKKARTVHPRMRGEQLILDALPSAVHPSPVVVKKHEEGAYLWQYL